MWANWRQTLKAKGYDLNQVETGDAQIDEDLMRLLEKLADNKPMIKEKGKEEPEVTILRRNETGGGEDSLKEKSVGKEVVQSLADKIPDDILERTRVRKKKAAFKEEAEHLGLEQESGEWPQWKKMLKKRNCPGSVKSGMKIWRRAAMTKTVYA